MLSEVLQDAPAAFPLLLSVGRKLEQLEVSQLKELQERVAMIVVDKVDSRLATQYAISVLCAQEV